MEELPYKDDKPVDSELQDLIAHLLKDILALTWASRNDWFFGIDTGWYYDPDESAIAPDGFLCLGVQRVREPNLRLSYVAWEENGVVPIFALEVVSKTPGGEYKKKKRIYAQQGVLYYVIYAPLRSRKRRLTIYRLNAQGEYELIDNDPVWMPEIGLGIGSGVGTYQGTNREWLYWYDRAGNRYPTSDEARLQAERQQRYAELLYEQEQRAREQAEVRQEQERQAREEAEREQRQAQLNRDRERRAREEAERKAEELVRRLRSLGIDPDDLNG
jgi:Uma2 family endonuclease